MGENFEPSPKTQLVYTFASSYILLVGREEEGSPPKIFGEGEQFLQTKG
jgi:hypothetical protein